MFFPKVKYCFDVCMNETGASLLKNSVEQTFAEKLRSLLIFGTYSRRYKDIYDIFYLKDIVASEKLQHAVQLLIFNDEKMREKTWEDIVARVDKTFSDKRYLKRVSASSQRWIDLDIARITMEIVIFLKSQC